MLFSVQTSWRVWPHEYPRHARPLRRRRQRYSPGKGREGPDRPVGIIQPVPVDCVVTPRTQLTTEDPNDPTT